MEPEANLSQEPTPTEAVEQPLEAAAAEAEITAVPEDTAPEEAKTEPEAQAAEPNGEAGSDAAPEAAQAEVPVQPSEPEPSAAQAETPAPEAAESGNATQADAPTIVATEDVAPARSKIDLARIAKEALIERAQQLKDSADWRKATEAQRALMEEWRAAGYAGKELNDKLWDEFRAARDVFFTRRDEHYAQLREEQGKVVEVKRQIIEEAKQATSEIRNWVATSNALDALMDRWKAAGNAGRENEQALWEEFNSIRREFRNRRKADLADRRTKERENAQAKRALVDEAKAIAESQEYTRENSDRMRALNNEYKQAGYAGKPANDTLWQEFRAAQNSYWEGNNARRDAQRRERTERLQEAVERKSGQIEHLKDQNETLTTRLESTLNPEKVAQIKQWIQENESRLGDLKEDIDEIKKKI